MAAALAFLAVGLLLRIPAYLLVFGLNAPLEHLQAASSADAADPARLLAPLVVLLFLARIVLGEIAEWRRRAERDHLTGLFSRFSFDREMERVGEQDDAVICCDLDRFKQINDRYGHHAGDEILRAFAAMLCEANDGACRIGGEEFAKILPGTSASEARDIAERVRLRFHHSRFPDHIGGLAPSASFGVAS